MKTLLSMALASLVAACAAYTPDAAPTNAERYRAYSAVRFSTVDSLEVARLDGSSTSSFYSPAFHRYRRLSNWETLEPSESQSLSELLKEQIEIRAARYAGAGDETLVELNSFCIFNPGFAVRMQTDRGPRDFLICLTCGDIAAYGDNPDGVRFPVSEEVWSELQSIYDSGLAE